MSFMSTPSTVYVKEQVQSAGSGRRVSRALGEIRAASAAARALNSCSLIGRFRFVYESDRRLNAFGQIRSKKCLFRVATICIAPLLRKRKTRVNLRLAHLSSFNQVQIEFTYYLLAILWLHSPNYSILKQGWCQAGGHLYNLSRTTWESELVTLCVDPIEWKNGRSQHTALCNIRLDVSNA